MIAKKGETVSVRSGPIIVQKYIDKKFMHMTTNSFQQKIVTRTFRGGAEVIPVCISHCNTDMGGVGHMNQVLEPINTARKATT